MIQRTAELQPVAGDGALEASSPRKRMKTWIGDHGRIVDCSLILVLLTIVGVVHAWGMNNDPLTWTTDPGTYVSQAWAVEHLGRLAPYSYFYDHPPGAWIQMAAWSILTNGFGRYHTAIAFGNECALIAALASAVLLYALARRLNFGRLPASCVLLLWGLCPLAVEYSRPAFIDNIAIPWVLLAFYLAYSRRMSLLAGVGAAAALGVAVDSKETMGVLLPALIYVYAQNNHRSNRLMTWLLSAFTLLTFVGLYIAYAALKGEFLYRSGRNTLMYSVVWQLVKRQGTGYIGNPSSSIHLTVVSWLGYDRYLLLASLAVVPLALVTKRLRPISLAFITQCLMVVKGGYVPYMQVADILPWAALVLVGAITFTIGGKNRDWARAKSRIGRIWLGARRTVAVALAVAFVAVIAPHWYAGLTRLMSYNHPTSSQLAERWLAKNVPRNDTVVVDPQLLVDLWGKYGFPHDKAVSVEKLDADPAVLRTTRHINYIAVEDQTYTSLGARTIYPSIFRAESNGIVVARIGIGPTAVVIWKISPFYDLRSSG
jgi:hypothetical protein